MAAMVSHTLAANLEGRATEVGLSLARLARLSDVGYRRLWENNLAREELDRVEAVLRAHEMAVDKDEE